VRRTGNMSQRVDVDAIAVILRSDFNFLRSQVFHRLVCSAMAKLKLERSSAQSQSHHLVTEADPENGPLSQKPAHRFNNLVECSRVSGAIGEEHSVGIGRQNLLGRSVGGKNHHLTTFLFEQAQDVVLDPAIQGRHPKTGLIRRPAKRSCAELRPTTPLVRLRAGNILDEIDAVQAGVSLNLFHQGANIVRIGGNDPRIAPPSRMWRVSARVSMLQSRSCGGR